MKTFLNVFFLERASENLDWVIYVLVFTLLLIVIGKLLFSYNFEGLGRFERFLEVNENQLLFGLIFQICFSFLIGAILLDFLPSDYDYIFDTPLLKVLMTGLIVLIYLGLRASLGGVAAYAFGISHDRNFNLKTNNYFRVHSVIALWVSVLLYYFSGINQMTILMVLLLLLITIRAYNYVFIFKNQPDKQSKILYYNILYLCALEILPLLVLFKFLNLW